MKPLSRQEAELRKIPQASTVALRKGANVMEVQGGYLVAPGGPTPAPPKGGSSFHPGLTLADQAAQRARASRQKR